VANQDTSFTLKVKVSPELGIGFVQLFVGDDKYIISSVEFDEGVTTERGQEVIIVAVSSRGNEFVSWDGQTTWLEEGATGDLRGVVKGDLELNVEFGKITQKDGPELVLPEIEIIEPTEFSDLGVRIPEGGGVISVEFGGRTRLVNSSELIKFSVPVGENVRVDLIPDDGYVFSTFDDTELTPRVGSFEMEKQEVGLSVLFVEKIPEPEPDEPDEEFDVLEIIEGPEDIDEVLFPGDEYILFKRTEDLHSMDTKEITPLDIPPADYTVEFELTYDETNGVLLSGGGMTNDRWVDLIFAQGVEYRFTSTDSRALIEIVDSEGDLVSADLGVFNNAQPVGDVPIILIPNEFTPRELFYRERFPNQSGPFSTPTPSSYERTGEPTENPLRRRHAHGSFGRIHVRKGLTQGRVSGYGYIEASLIDLNDPLATTMIYSSTRIKLGGVQTPGIFSYGVSGDKFSSITSHGGFDYMTQTDNVISYQTVGRTGVFNIFTSVFAEIYDTSSLGVSEINEYFCSSLDFSDSYDILNEDLLYEISIGRTEYIDLYKKLVQLNILFELVTTRGGGAELLKSSLSTLILESKKINLTEGGGTMITGLLSDIFEEGLLNSVVDLLYEVFSYIEEDVTGPTTEILDTLFAVGRVCGTDVVATVTAENLESISTLMSNFESKVLLAKNEINSFPLPLRLALRMTPECENPGLKFLGASVTKKLDTGFMQFLTGNPVLTIENIKNIYGKTISFSWGDLHGCYEVLQTPAEFTQYDTLYESSIDTIFNATTMYDDTNVCCNDLPEYQFVGDEESVPEEEVFSLKLIEGGESSVMLDVSVTNQSHPIEYLGNDEYRIYLDETASQGSLGVSSPGYFVVPTNYAVPMEQRYLKIVYNSDEVVRDVIEITSEHGTVNANNVVVVEYNQTTEMGKIFVVTDANHGLSTGDKVMFLSTDREELNENDYVVEVIAEKIFYVSFKAVGYTTETFNQAFHMINLSVVTANLVRIYYDGEASLEVGDTVAFDKSCNGQVFNLVTSESDEHGNYFVVNEALPPGVKKVVKSHVSDELPEVIDFMYVTHLQYYEVAGVTYGEDRLWLSYDPDTSPEGRAGHKVSYVQFFHNGL
jgi:hypothetical protein